MSKNTKKKFYNTNWFMWLMLVFFAPIGIALLWLRKDVSFSKKTKSILSAIFTVLFVLVAATGSKTPTDDKLTSASKATNIEEKLSEKQTGNDEPKTEKEDVSTSNEEIKSLEVDKETTNKVTDELFEGYKLIEVDGGNSSGHREPNVVVDIGL